MAQNSGSGSGSGGWLIHSCFTFSNYGGSGHHDDSPFTRGMVVVVVDTIKLVVVDTGTWYRAKNNHLRHANGESFFNSENTTTMSTYLIYQLNGDTRLHRKREGSVSLFMYRLLAKPVTSRLTDPTKAASNKARSHAQQKP
jgi:hypothetical protein